MSNVVNTAFAVASSTSRIFSNHFWIRKGPRLSTVISKKSNNHTFFTSPKKPTIHSTPLIVSPILPKFSFLTKITQNNHFLKRQNMSSNTFTFESESEPEWNYSESDIAQKFLFFNVLKDGRIHVLCPPSHKVKVPPSFGSTADVVVKDVQISSDVSVRIFLPSSYASTNACTTHKLPVVLYVHGGGFCMQSAFSEDYTRFGSQIAAEANAMVVSMDYGLFPTRPIPACYDDSRTALEWVTSHSKGSGPEPWINDHADLRRIFVGGDSAGGNISHTLLSKVGSLGLQGDAKVEGMILIHPYFGEDDKMWMFMCPTNLGPKDPRMKPAVEDLARIGCDRVLVLLAEKDVLYGVGKMYVDELIKSGWKGKVEIMENKDKEHCFHYSNHMDLEAVAIRQRIASFIHNQS